MKSDFFDDVTNACMVASYVAVRYRYLDRVDAYLPGATQGYVDVYRQKEEDARRMMAEFSRLKGGGVADVW